MKIQHGDRVTHITFPPIEGVVVGVQEMINSEPRLSVKQDNGMLFWDYESTWCKNDTQESVSYTTSFEENDDNIIDVDFREV